MEVNNLPKKIFFKDSLKEFLIFGHDDIKFNRCLLDKDKKGACTGHAFLEV